MIDADLPAGAAVFLDASVFIHNFAPNALFGPTATEFLERIENQEMSGITTTHILSEVAHRLMTTEAMRAFGWKSAVSPHEAASGKQREATPISLPPDRTIWLACQSAGALLVTANRSGGEQETFRILRIT
jgi:predicted nucleic acid-binding protein